MPRSQPELLFHEVLHLKEPLVDSLAFYHFGTEQGEASSNITLYHKSVPARSIELRSGSTAKKGAVCKKILVGTSNSWICYFVVVAVAVCKKILVRTSSRKSHGFGVYCCFCHFAFISIKEEKFGVLQHIFMINH